MGKKKYIETPERMWELFEDYKKSINDNDQWKQFQYVGRNGDRVTDALKVPYTMCGFENYVAGLSTEQKPLPMELSHYFANYKDDYKDFLAICSRIKSEIRDNQIIGGMPGFYNPSITQRLNGLTDKKEVDQKGNITISFED